ncbi:MAG TPA: PAS domain-containing protein [Vicinamibacterales bacterium]|nr:PAS domain-containing protein [Vicinamibacterales bacterium]
MNTLHILSLRRTTALGKLARLQKRAERIPAPASAVLSAALSEFAEALEELQVATEQLQEHLDTVAEARHEAQVLRQQFSEYAEILPLPCLWTNADGDVEQANDAAAALLNVSPQHLAGRPLMLFFTDRGGFTDALTALNEGVTSIVEIAALVRPRERRPRPVRVVGRRLQHDPRRCWFIAVDDETAATAG